MNNTIISSTADQLAHLIIVYCVSQAVYVAAKVGRDGVRLNCLAPSVVLTEKVKRRMPEDQRPKVAASFPLGRLGEPEDAAVATLFLRSDTSSWLTGVTIDVAGGRIMV